MADDWPDRWKHIEKLLERSGPFAEADFEPSSEVTLTKNTVIVYPVLCSSHYAG